ncbi:hypothetical protein [Iodobacter fluviatilis]|uniref:SopE GEF domain-containing protein n=1 Tax=Iodobacter fluviatilis TaxID=537 RepID=A0A377Q4B6_9NEIS|nr:hypothetical protein [Iodobacter fluviatilis]TCU80227.1 SopE GEF domain-containing protein [Iodobacter fluviatilis]STQ90116.1 Toxin sopE [Iodobacter fluviatilis]
MPFPKITAGAILRTFRSLSHNDLDASTPTLVSYRGRTFEMSPEKKETRSQSAPPFTKKPHKAAPLSPVTKPLQAELGKFQKKLAKDAVKDPETVTQTVQMSLAAVYSRAKDQCCQRLLEQGHKAIPEDYFREIGEAAHKAGLSCSEKNGIWTPTAAGANGIANGIMIPVNSKFPKYCKTPEQIKSNADYVHSKLLEIVEPYARKSGKASLIEFDATLAKIAAKYEKPVAAPVIMWETSI